MSLSNGWTGGQYSLARATLGGYLAVHFCLLLPWGEALFSRYGAVPDASASPLVHVLPNLLAACDEPWVVAAVLSASVAASLALAAGALDRVAAVFLWYVWACLVGRNPLILNPGIPYVGWILLAHACMPPGPFGSWAARTRQSPAQGWSFPPSIFGAAWILMAAGYAYSGVTKLSSPSWLDGSALAYVLENPLARPGAVRDALVGLPQPWLKLATWGTLGLELAFAPLAMVRKLRPWLWASMLGLHLLLVVVIDFADLSLGMVMLHVFTFDPAWIPPRAPAATETLLHDESCGRCRRIVRFAGAEAPKAAFHLVPRTHSAHGLVLVTEDGRAVVGSAAARHLLRRLGGLWRLLGTVPAVAAVGAMLLRSTASAAER